jgi:hypothetical protein
MGYGLVEKKALAAEQPGKPSSYRPVIRAKLGGHTQNYSDTSAATDEATKVVWRLS